VLGLAVNSIVLKYYLLPSIDARRMAFKKKITMFFFISIVGFLFLPTLYMVFGYPILFTKELLIQYSKRVTKLIKLINLKKIYTIYVYNSGGLHSLTIYANIPKQC